MTTTLEKQLKRQVTVDEIDYVVTIDPEGLRMTTKGKRKPEVALQWRDLVSGEAAMAVALNASIGARATGAKARVEIAPPEAKVAAKRKPR
jgi:hypothetical protein